MSKLGALLFAAVFGLVGAAIFNSPIAFWIFFCFSAFIGVPIGAIQDAVRNRRERREQREDDIAQAHLEAVQAAIEKGRPSVNIDARSVHLHQN